MRHLSAWLAAAWLAVPSLALGSSTPTPGKAEPPVVPYECSDGRTATVIYRSGSDYRHATALVTYDGQTLEMRAAPTLYGVRYRSNAGGEDEPALAWSLRGEEARLTEAPEDDSYTGQEREIVRCVRLRTAASGAHASAEDQGQDH